MFDSYDLLIVTFIALVLWLVSKAIFGAYFKAKENYVERIADKLKGLGNGKD